MTEVENGNTTPDAQPQEPKKKWSWTKRIVAGVLLVGIGLGSGVAIGAGSGHHGGFWRAMGHGQFDSERAASRIDGRVERIMSRIDGTPEQQQQVSTIAKSAMNDIMALGITPRETRGKLLELFRADTIDPAAFEAVRAEQVGKIDAGSRRLVQALTDAAAVLTPEQRRELTQRMNERQARRQRQE